MNKELKSPCPRCGYKPEGDHLHSRFAFRKRLFRKPDPRPHMRLLCRECASRWWIVEETPCKPE